MIFEVGNRDSLYIETVVTLPPETIGVRIGIIAIICPKHFDGDEFIAGIG